MTLVFDPSDQATLRNPHPIFKRLREEEPVHWSPSMAGWIVTSYELATKVLMDAKLFSADRFTSFQKKHVPQEKQDATAEIIRWFRHWMVFRDPPDHTRLRRHMANVLSPRVLESMRDTCEEIVEMLLDKLPKNQDFDFYPAFSLMMPGLVVADLLSVERSRLMEVKQWSDDMMTVIGSSRGIPDKYERAKRGANAMGGYFLDLVKKRRAEPQDDVVSMLIKSEVDGERLSDDELIGSMMMVLNGGHETTANLINNSMLALAHHPDAVTDLRENPAKMTTAIEEFLRYDSPIYSIGRIVTQDMQFGDKTLRAGDRIFAMLIGANRDPKIFNDPNKLDIERTPNQHMAFGKGSHFCLGTPLAKLEGQIAIGAILKRFGKIELREPVESIPWLNSMVTHGPTRMPLRLS